MEEQKLDMKEIIIAISNELNKKIENKELTIEEIADKTGMGVTYIENIIYKERNCMPKAVSLKFISDICENFNIKIDR